MVVVGPYRSGTSCVAGILSTLGVEFGACKPPTHHNPKGFFEHFASCERLKRAFDERTGDVLVSQSEVGQILLDWRIELDALPAPVVGLKHPLLCYLGVELDELFAGADVRYVFTERPAAAITESLVRCNWQWIRGVNVPELVLRLISARESTSRGKNVFRVSFENLLAAPDAFITRLAEFAGIHRQDEQFRRACAFVDTARD